ncbi:hypothetical protein F2P81_008930 [Scophthalmus maximus]|uniref:Uncharacterized protein n=1 Tax=Scophthalmus maximus TaxID=52904 RepID=A0A6A4STA7_SCOMX|nr:hypothetical protein F2P81_008930 [Scophthalmus maximus]
MYSMSPKIPSEWYLLSDVQLCCVRQVTGVTSTSRKTSSSLRRRTVRAVIGVDVRRGYQLDPVYRSPHDLTPQCRGVVRRKKFNLDSNQDRERSGCSDATASVRSKTADTKSGSASSRMSFNRKGKRVSMSAVRQDVA